MSRDRRDRPDVAELDAAAAAAGPSDARGGERSAELLTAYVDGVAELPADERRAIEAWLAADPEARTEAAAVQSVVGQLRALPPEGDEPDWAAMERSIRQAVAAEPPRPWWRRWQWLVPAMTCATAAAVLIVLWPRRSPGTAPGHGRAPDLGPGLHAPAPAVQPPAAPGDDVVALWLDGSEVDVDLSAAGGLPVAAGDALGDLELGAASPGDGDEPDDVGLLPAADLAWVDHLDDAALDRAERWLERPRSAGTPSIPGSPRTAKSPTRKKG